MLSGVINSPRAIQVNIEIMRAFIEFRRLFLANKELAEKITALESKYNHQFKVVFDALREIMNPPEIQKRKIGIVTDPDN